VPSFYYKRQPRTRPRSARAALSSYRQRLGFKSLTGDEAIADVVHGHEAARPATKRQAAGLTSTMLRYVSDTWGRSPSWFERQCSTIFELGFVSLMRLGEIITVRRAGIVIVFTDGSEVRVADLKKMPGACSQVISSILKHIITLRGLRSESPYLFPSRRYWKRGKQRPHGSNHVAHQSLITALRKALQDCVPLMTRQWASLYSGHSLRVGGSNHMRKLGVADDIHRRLGGWMSLTSSQGYMQLSPQEQFRYTVGLASQQV